MRAIHSWLKIKGIPPLRRWLNGRAVEFKFRDPATWVQILAVLIEISKDEYTPKLFFNHDSMNTKSNKV